MFWADLMKGGAEGLVGGVGSLAVKLREAFTGESVVSSEERAKILEMTTALEQAANNLDLTIIQGQNAINLEEAKSDSLYKSGWRPAVGWVYVAGLAYTFVVKPLLPWLVQVGALLLGYVSVLPLMPEIPMGDLIILLSGLLGLGTMRTFEKFKGVHK